MQVVCNKCNAKYKISDDKLNGRDRIRLKCKKCDNIIEAKVNNIKDEDTNSLFSTSSKKSIVSSVNNQEGDIFEDNLFSGAQNEFSFEDVKETLVLNKSSMNDSFISNDSNKDPQFKSNFQMDFSDKTNTKDMFDVKDSSSTRGGISFETTQQISVDKFNEYQKNKEQESALGLNNQNQNESNLNLKKTNRGIDSKTRDKFEEISKEFSKKPSSKGASFLKFIFFIIFVLLGVFAFVLYKNNWQVNFDKLPEMVKVAFNGGSLENSTPIKKNKVKSLKDQFFIDSKKIKTDLIKISNRGKNKKYAVVVSGELKNTDDTKKSLTTVNVKIDSILDKKTILEKRVYAGNIFTANEIIKAKTSENLDAEYLQSGKNGSNWAVLPGKTTPFMVVFYLDKSINLKEIKIKIEVMSTQ